MGTRLINLFIVCLFVMTFVSGAEVTTRFVHQQNTFLNLKENCYVDGYPCPSDYYCNLTLVDPKQNILVDNEIMTNGLSYHNYTASKDNFTTLGIYETNVFCTNNVKNGSSQFFFRVTPNGEENTISQGIIYLVVIGLSLIIFVLCLWGAITIPWKNNYNQEGILQINSYKYLKVVLWGFVYLIGTWIFYIGWKISDNFLYSSLMGRFFYWLFLITISFAIPLFIGGIWIVAIKFVYDLKLSKIIQRGLPIR